jgi:hypothetical protein
LCRLSVTPLLSRHTFTVPTRGLVQSQGWGILFPLPQRAFPELALKVALAWIITSASFHSLPRAFSSSTRCCFDPPTTCCWDSRHGNAEKIFQSMQCCSWCYKMVKRLLIVEHQNGKKLRASTHQKRTAGRTRARAALHSVK